jgi:hypothetical protein
MPLRVGFDLDGVLADLASAYKEIEARLFGPNEVEDEVPETPGENDEESTGRRDDDKSKDIDKDAAARRAADLKALQHKREIVWRAIQTTDNFWTTLTSLEPDAVRRLHELTARHGWEAFFITQRPETTGDTVQRQTQRWLARQGFDLPSVIVVRGARGKVAAALELDYLVDDTPKNCVDVISDSTTRPILILRNINRSAEQNARRLGIGVVRSVAEALDVLERAQAVRNNPTLFGRLAKAVGWKS